MNQQKSLALIAITVALTAGLLLGRHARPAVTPADTSAEAGFARDMGDHHQQAVDMAFIIRDKSTDSPVRVVAFDIINTQATQHGIMMGWLQQWGLPPTTTRPAMAWMDSGDGHGTAHSHDGMMPGMATPEEMDKLGSLTGKDADILFMQLMIRHHVGGIIMAKGLLERSARPEVRYLAQTIVTGQQAEIEALTQMLQDRGADA